MTGDDVQFGSGEPVIDDQGNAVVYAPDAQYRLAQDIELPAGEIWQLPENFTGRIAPQQKSDDRPLYDAESDTVYLYHPLQLAVAAREDAAQQPVMAGDNAAETFSSGQVIYPDGEDQPYLTYDPEHRYVISALFNTDLPVSTYAETVDVPGPNQDGNRPYEGRDFPGQVIKTINGVDYILIGN